MNTETFVRMLPKAELHLHIEGTVPWDMARQYAGESLAETPVWLRKEYRFADFADFRTAMRPGTVHVLTSPERYHAVATAAFRTLLAQNTRYVEISFGADLVQRQSLPVDEVVAAIRDAVPSGMVVCVIGGLNRRAPVTPGRDALADVLLTTAGIDGIDLHGDERHSPPAPFAPLYIAARAQGYLTKAHAGELCGPEAVRATLETLQVQRIAHGTTAVQDEALVQRLIAEDVTLDIGLTSNVKLQVAPSVAAHPIGPLLRRGVRVTVNTDDPAVFGCTLTGELLALVAHQQFTPHELAQLQRNAFRVAKLAEAQRQAIMAEIESLLTHVE